jgi:hypothetical protein
VGSCPAIFLVDIRPILVQSCPMHRSMWFAPSFALTLLILAPSCKRAIECTSEVTAGEGTFKAVARGEGEEGPVMKQALRDACQKMCVSTKAPMLDACVARCVVDAGAAKIGARTSCKK